MDTSDEWITTRTGIRERRLARDDEPVSEMAAAAGRIALERAGAKPEEIGLVVVATITPDTPMPSTACLVQARLGLVNATCFDLNAACSGFIYALETARQFVATGSVKKALVIGADKMSMLVDWSDRTTCVLFGDGAGAVVVEPGSEGRGILSCSTGGDGSMADLLVVPAGGSAMPASEETVKGGKHFLHMEGNRVFKGAVRGMVEVSSTALELAGAKPEELDVIIPHQANLRIIQSMAEKLKLNLERFVINLDRLGNTTAATIPLALDHALAEGRLKDDDLLLFVAFGGGLTWGASVLRWGR
jgi:3-oxoacyl-[acyl-carrier-protein] synthase-3